MQFGINVPYVRHDSEGACSPKSSGKSSGKTELQILGLLSGNPEITIPELDETIKMTSRGIEKQIAKLRRNGRIHHFGPAKGGYWEVVGVDTRNVD